MSTRIRNSTNLWDGIDIRAFLAYYKPNGMEKTEIAEEMRGQKLVKAPIRRAARTSVRVGSTGSIMPSSTDVPP